MDKTYLEGINTEFLAAGSCKEIICSNKDSTLNHKFVANWPNSSPWLENSYWSVNPGYILLEQQAEFHVDYWRNWIYRIPHRPWGIVCWLPCPGYCSKVCPNWFHQEHQVCAALSRKPGDSHCTRYYCIWGLWWSLEGGCVRDTRCITAPTSGRV